MAVLNLSWFQEARLQCSEYGGVPSRSFLKKKTFNICGTTIMTNNVLGIHKIKEHMKIWIWSVLHFAMWMMLPGWCLEHWFCQAGHTDEQNRTKGLIRPQPRECRCLACSACAGTEKDIINTAILLFMSKLNFHMCPHIARQNKCKVTLCQIIEYQFTG